MKIEGLKRSIWIGFCVVACLIVVACRQTNATKILSPNAAPQSRLDWNMKTLVDAYQKAGHTNPKWDESARGALTEFARVRSQTTISNEAWGSIISNNCSAAVEAGCDDPMVRYLYIRTCLYLSASKQEILDKMCEASQNMAKSSYPDIRKYYAWQRTAQQITNTFGYGTNVPSKYREMGIWGSAVTNLLDALSDPTMPPEEFYDASHDFLEEYKGDLGHRQEGFPFIEKRFPVGWKTVPLLQLLRGEGYLEMAWHARGSGFANTVTTNGWKLFTERLGVAEEALTNAWQLNTNDARIAIQMMRVELGQGQGRARMDLWFHRAMELNPNYYDACSYKLFYLEPKWYGTVQDMLAFGRECVINKRWGGHVPLILLDAHVDIRNQFVGADQRAGYWKQPQVWKDLNSAFDRFFELNPDAIGWYHDYAWYAYQAEDWATLNRLIPKLGSINYNYFGGKSEFDKMVALAKEHAGKSL